MSVPNSEAKVGPKYTKSARAHLRAPGRVVRLSMAINNRPGSNQLHDHT